MPKNVTTEYIKQRRLE